MLGYSEVILLCDNEPGILALKRLVLKTRQAMGLKTREASTVAYDKSNSLAENSIGRVRPLKADTQNSYVLFDGQAIVLSRSVRRISTTWRSHMAYYLHCKCFSWQFKSGFGPRVLPTMKKAVPKAVSFEMPLEPIEDSLAVPVSPPRQFVEIESPRASASARASSVDRDEAKRQRINRLRADYEKRLSEVKLAYKEYFTVDDYTTDLDVNEDFNDDDDDIWADEDSVKLQGIPLEVWSDDPIDKTPPTPERWIDELADRIEIERLCTMRVLVRASEFSEEPTGKLTTKFVRDWRLKMFGEGPDQYKRWMRRSRLVAREFATSKRLDTFSPATGAHVSNILPFKYLLMKSELADMKCKADYDVVLSSLDVSDAFLQVEQDKPIRVNLQGESWVICRNLPGQRLGAKQWFQFLRSHLETTMGFEFSPEQPCMARTKECTILIHVDDILFCGLRSFWNDVFLPNMSQKFKVSHDELKGNGTSIKFLRRKITEVPDGLILTRGTSVEKVVQVFEQAFGVARQQKVPCNADLQLIDSSAKLDEKDASAFRSVIGLCLYVVSLSSCESELHALVSCACDGIFVRACIEFALNCEIKHLVYTDNAAARQLSCRQGCGKVRHVSGKILWIQQKTQDGSLELRQVATLENLSDIGTKCLSKQRLFFLMHETGLVYIPTFEPVGQEEFSNHNAKLGSRRQLKKIARALVQMTIAMGLEPGGTVVAAQKCPSDDMVMVGDSSWDYKWLLVSACVFAMCLVFGCLMLKRVTRVQQCERDIHFAQEQLADHYGYAAELGTRLDACVERAEVRDDTTDALAARVAVVEEDLTEGTSALEEALDCVRYGLMELGGFVRFTSLSREQRAHLLTQERGNFVLWQVRTQAETTDAAEIHVPERFRDDNEDAEEENVTDDENVEQPAGPNAEGLTMEVLTQIRNVFQRLWRFCVTVVMSAYPCGTSATISRSPQRHQHGSRAWRRPLIASLLAAGHKTADSHRSGISKQIPMGTGKMWSQVLAENRILHTENKQEELQLPFTPRRFQQIKANCLKVQEEIDAQLRLLKPKRPVHLSNAGSGANGAHGSRTGSPLRRRRPRTPKDRLRLKIAQCRSQPELLVSNTASKPSLSNSRSVALELERELGKGPLKPQDVSRFCEKRERRLAAQEAAASRPSSATNFVHRNRSGCLDFMARREVQLEMQNLRRCVRTDMAKRKRLADLEAMHQAAAEDYWKLGIAWIKVGMGRHLRPRGLNRFFKEETMSHRSQGLNDPQHEHPKEELSEEVRVKQALENLGKYMPSKVMKLFTRALTLRFLQFQQQARRVSFVHG
eukprot:s1418_g14.t1